MKKILHHKRLVIFIGVALVGLGMFIFKNKPVLAVYLEVQPATFTESLLISGKVQLDNAVPLRVEVGGTVESVAVSAGTSVQSGALLLVLKDPALNLALSQAEADLDKARADLNRILRGGTAVQTAVIAGLNAEREGLVRDLKRIQTLHDQGAVSDSDLNVAQDALNLKNIEINKESARLHQAQQDQGSDQAVAQAAVAAAESRVKSARLQVERLQVSAPFSGIVIQSDRLPGEKLDAGAVAAILARSTDKRCDIAPDEKYMSVLKLGQPVSLYADANPAERIQGVISWIAPEVDAETGTVPMRIALKTDHPWLIQNLMLRCEIITATLPDSLSIPADYLIGEGNSTVLIFENGKAVTREIQGVPSDTGKIRVVSGLKSGDIVLSPQGLEANQSVQLKPSAGDGS